MSGDVNRGEAVALVPDLAEIRRHVDVPTDVLCVFVGGSVVSGFAHANSDLDVFVITSALATAPGADMRSVATPSHANVQAVEVLDPPGPTSRWDVQYWSAAQVEDLVRQFDEPSANAGTLVGVAGGIEAEFLYRLSMGVAVVGDEWLDAQRKRLSASTYNAAIVQLRLDSADALLDDAKGQLESQDLRSAALTSCLAFGSAVDAMLARLGQLSPNPKWRARQMSLVDDSLLSFDEYWSIQTFRGLEAVGERAWAERTIDRSQQLIIDLELLTGT